MAVSGQTLEIVLVGKTGHGKSATGNTILGLSKKSGGFTSSSAANSVTKVCERKCRVVRGGRSVAVTDTPGTMDTRNQSSSLEELASTVVKCPNGFSAFLIVLRFGTRMTKEEENAIEKLSTLFGEKFFDYAIVIITHGNQFQLVLEEEEEDQQWEFLQFLKYKGGLRLLLEKTKDRCILIENTGPNKETYSQLIINAVDGVLLQNRGFPYTNKYFEQAREMERVRVAEKERQSRIKAEMENDAGCFPAESVVILDDFKEIKLKDLRVGQRVLSGFSNGIHTFSEVYMFGHAEKDKLMSFYCLETEDHLLKLSSDHHVFVYEATSVITKAAKEVVTGDSLLIYDANFDSLRTKKIIKIWRSDEKGVFAPFTMNGTIIVNGVLASCYIDMVPPVVAHPLLWPVRQLYRFSPSTLAVINKTDNRGIPQWITWCIDNAMIKVD